MIFLIFLFFQIFNIFQDNPQKHLAIFFGYKPYMEVQIC
jgi:hypothetical protein